MRIVPRRTMNISSPASPSRNRIWPPAKVALAQAVDHGGEVRIGEGLEHADVPQERECFGGCRHAQR